MHVVLVAQLCVTVTPWTVARQAPLSMGILQVRILEWAAMPSSTGSSRPRDQTHASCGPCCRGRFFTAEPLGKPLSYDILTPFTETNLTETLKTTGFC